jgi:hypothetical protein
MMSTRGRFPEHPAYLRKSVPNVIVLVLEPFSQECDGTPVTCDACVTADTFTECL